jgi:hypothetical protein
MAKLRNLNKEVKAEKQEQQVFSHLFLDVKFQE